MTPTPEFEVLALTAPVTARHRHEMADVETVITHAYDAETLVVNDGKITSGQTLSLGDRGEMNLNTDDMNLPTPTFTGSTLENVLKQFERKFPDGIEPRSGLNGAPRFFVGRFDGGAILIAHANELEQRFAATESGTV